MYKLTVVNQYGKVSILKGKDLNELKKVAKRMNKNGCSVEISKETVIFRIVQV